MAAPNFPNNRGGNTVLAEEPETLGTNEAIGASSTMVLKLIHVVEQISAAMGAAAPAGLDAMVDAVVTDAGNLRRAANLMSTREKSTRTLQPMTRIPAVEYGAQTNVAQIRLNTIQSFNGVGCEPREVIRWISKVLEFARVYQLTFDASIILLIHASSGEVTDFITELRDEGNNLDGVVRALELRYADLCLPEEAVSRCNNMTRRANESLPTFLDRLRFMARMARRMIQDDEARREAVNQIVEANIRRVLPRSVTAALEERVLVRTRMGMPPFTTREIEKECIELEKKRDERKLEIERAGRRPVAAARAIARSGFDTGYESASASDLAGSSEDERDPELEVRDAMVAEIRRQFKKFTGIPLHKERVREGVAKRIPWRNDRAKPVVASAQEPQRGPPLRLSESPRKSIPELLALANCERGDCIHCGSPGHMMRQDACPLRGKPIVDRACPACKKGLHQADDCLRIFQKRAGAARVTETDSSDLNE